MSYPTCEALRVLSDHHYCVLQSLGATHVLDRRLSKDALKERIVQICGGTPFYYAFDAISVEETQRVAYDSICPGGKFTEVFLQCLPRHDPASGKKVLHAWRSFEVTTPGVGVREFGRRFMCELSGWLAEGKMKLNVVEVLPGGLNGVKAGRGQCPQVHRTSTRNRALRLAVVRLNFCCSYQSYLVLDFGCLFSVKHSLFRVAKQYVNKSW
ncbi:hypothetical protein OG21DRAFT_304535 [Imleria badia]|nr:hypothetical protein OG21DRAFT_304535 [Imleria badia]